MSAEVAAGGLPWWVRSYVRSVYHEREGFEGAESVELEEPGKRLAAYGQQLHSEQGEDRRAMADGAMFLYYSGARYSLRGSRLAGAVMPAEPPFRNVVKKYIDAKTAFVFTNKVKTYFITEEGSVEERDQAEAMTQAVEAQFEASDLYGATGFLVCQDGQMFDGGVIKTVCDVPNMRVLNERVFPWELYMPLEEARTGKARQCLHRVLIDRAVLAGMFPEFKKEIAAAPATPDDWLLIDGQATTSDLVAVWEGWHLPSTVVDQNDKKAWGKDKDGKFSRSVDPGHDGRHSMCLDADGTTLVDEPWVFDHFPLGFYLPQHDPLGPWSISLAEALGPIQLELIKLGKRIANITNFHGRPIVGVDRRARVNIGKITNDVMTIVETTGSPGQAIQQVQTGSVPSDLYKREAEHDEEAGKIAGMNDMSVYGQKPAGMQHEPGMQLLLDTESKRQNPAHTAWERLFVQVGINNVDAFRILAEKDANFTLVFGDDEKLVRHKWSEIDLGAGKYKYRAWPTNLLPSTPAAKTQLVLTMLQGGLFAETPEARKARALLPFPDFKGVLGDNGDTEKNISDLLDMVEKDGMSIDTMPEPWNNPALCQELCAQRINKVQREDRRRKGARVEERVEGLRLFYDSARRLELMLQAQSVQAQQGVAPAGPGGGAPPGAPPSPGPNVPAGPPGVPAAAA